MIELEVSSVTDEPRVPVVPETLARAVEHHQAGRLAEAHDLYVRTLEVEPRNADALHLLGVIANQGNHHDTAADYVLRAISQSPNQADFQNSLGNARRGQGRLDEAIAAYHRALSLQPAHVEAHFNLGHCHLLKNDLENAATLFWRVLQLAPSHIDACVSLGNVRQRQGKLEESLACFQRALKLKSDSATAHQLGGVLMALGRVDEALAALSRALVIDPQDCVTLNNLGVIYTKKGDLPAAIACYQRSFALSPNSITAKYGVANAQFFAGEMDAAIASYQQVLEMRPDHAGAMCSLLVQWLTHCEWGGVPALARRIHDFAAGPAGIAGTLATQSVSSLVMFYLPLRTTAALHQRVAKHWAGLVSKSVESLHEVWAWQKAPAVPRSAKPKLTVGYLSADFRQHAVSFLIAELLECHDRAGFRTIAYSYGENDGSALRRRLEQGVDQFVDIRSLAHRDAARRIAADGVDILVDLTGYTRDTRTEILALRPAPIQVNFLGFPGTMGADFIDYILVDDYVVPSDQQPWFTEKLVHLPGCYQVNDSRRQIAETPTRRECGLPETGFVFCSFNINFKITPDVFAVWMNLLRSVPGSVLWLYEGNTFVAGNLRREAEAVGVSGSRLIFAGPLPNAQHLARQRLADLFLDTFPYTGHTAASDALWAGCPLLTLVGDTFSSRVAGSILTTLGLPELITTSLEAYEATALQLARDPCRLQELRTRLEASRATSSLFDAEHFARKLERAYAQMWEIYAAGEEPRAFRVEEQVRGLVCEIRSEPRIEHGAGFARNP